MAHDIPIRQIDFGFDAAAVPPDWYRGDAFLSTFLDTLSLVFPEGERFFVDSVKRFRRQLTDPALRIEVAGFIGQEAMHGREHRAFNQLLPAHGLPAAPRLEAHVLALLDLGRRVLPLRAQLAVTCALEHFTATLAERVLTQADMRDGMHPTVRALLTWHALEESEHKAVAFDVYQAVGGGYPVRVAIMLLTTAIFFAEVAHIQARFLAARGILWRPQRWLPGLWHLFGRPGHFTRMIPAYLAYFRPGFHPSDHDNRALTATWRERLFGDDGELAARARTRTVA